MERAVIDTTLPFQSVKAAVSLFGERADVKKLQLPEKHGTREAELHHLKEELAEVNVQLKDSEKAKAEAFADLTEARTRLEVLTKKLEESSYAENSAGYRGERMHPISPSAYGLRQSSPMSAEEKHVVWEVELKVVQEQHMTAVAELEAAKKELERVHQELDEALHEKESAMRQAEEALATAEINAKRVEELSNEILGTNESLVLVKMACMEASKERAALLAAKRADVSSTGVSAHGLVVVKELELKLAEATEELTRLNVELATAKEGEEQAVKVASQRLAMFEQAKTDLQEVQIQATTARINYEAVRRELEVATSELEKALENGHSLQATTVALQAEVDAMRKDLADLRKREANASVAVLNLTSELASTKTELQDACAGEAKAQEAISGLLQTLQQITGETEAAKQSANVLKEEAGNARVEVEEAKSATRAAECELVAALKVADAAKAAEAVAIGKFQTLFEKVNAARASEVEAGTSIAISQEEYDTMKKKVFEAEELANIRVAAASAQVDAAKSGEAEFQRKLEMLNEDIDAMKNAANQALKRAEMAEAAKLAVESEMRRWRDKERQRREREGNTVGVAQKDSLKMGDNSNRHVSFARGPPPESLAQILNMKLPPVEKENKTAHGILSHKKKKHLLPSLGTFLGKKNQPTIGLLQEDVDLLVYCS